MFPSGRPGMNREGKGFANPFFFSFLYIILRKWVFIKLQVVSNVFDCWKD